MKRVLRDHGEILHEAGRHGAFPVRGADGEIGFASHGALEGRRPIGWQDFFPALHAARKVVVVDEDGTLSVVAEGQALARSSDEARPKGEAA